MTTYLLDGNTFTEFEDQTKPHFQKVTYRLSQLSGTDNVCISVISAYEYQYGISKAPEREKTLLKHTADFILASMALEHDAVLVSADSIFSKIKEFQRDLKIENWLQ